MIATGVGPQEKTQDLDHNTRLVMKTQQGGNLR